MTNLDINLFPEKSLRRMLDSIKTRWHTHVDFDIDDIIEIENQSNYPHKWDFNVDKTLNEKIDELNEDVLKLVNFVDQYYLMIEINNKIKMGIISFAEGIAMYNKDKDEDELYLEKNIDLSFKNEVAKKIRSNRNALFDSIGNISQEERRHKISEFWREKILKYYFEKYPLFYHNLSNLSDLLINE